MTESYKKLIATLEEIFQLDQADLDFGIYRIMNQKRTEINDFLQNKLLVQVDDILAYSSAGDTKDLKKELENLENTLRSAGIDPDTNPKVNELRTQYHSAGSPEALSNEVFSHLTSFFRRYYNQGDFISQRRYKNDVYAIPYEGEEVKLYWANFDQYYIKTGENFKNYTFKIDDGRIVHFRLRDANTEQNNNKALQGKERRFKLAEEDVVNIENNELSIWYTYEPQVIKEAQADLNKAAIVSVIPLLPDTFKIGLQKLLPTKSNPGRTLLEKHLNDYTSRNTFDYFVHKNLGGFLNRELDFYIKNEILHIDDINLDLPQAFDKQLRVIKALKSIAQKIITMLAQIEDFQKKLWLKKKFVMQSDYCITLDRVDESFYPDIIANSEQIKEWIHLFAINEIKPDAITLPFTEPLTIDFLKANPFLLLDTQHFSKDWKYKLLATIDNIDEQSNGLLINTENFQGLNLLIDRYKGQIKCTYNDPPYNTGNDGFAYKDSFQHSSWMTFMFDRMSLIHAFLKETGVFMLSVDEIEETNAKLVFNHIFDRSNYITDIIWEGSSKNDQKYISISHEYILVGLKDKDLMDRSNERWLEKKEGLDDIYAAFEKIKTLHLNDFDAQSKALKDFYKSLPADDPARNSSHYNCVEKRGIYFPDNISKPAKGYYYDVIHPVTGRPCKKPKGGWRFIEETMNDQLKQDLIHFGADETTVPCRKSFLHETEYMSTRSVVYQDNRVATKLNKDFFNDKDIFQNPKYYLLLSKFFKFAANTSDVFLDAFAGSGTTAHSVISLNQIDSGSRKYILLEMGEYFNTVTKPRVQKVVYSQDWKDGKPVSRQGISHCFKYLRLESYEDTLNNLQLKRSGAQQSLLENAHFGEEYLLHYMLDVESRDSLLNAEMFKKPFGYTLKVTENNELKEQEVDLVETFNYLVGLIVESMQIIKGTVVVQGKNLQGEKILIIWRDMAQTDNAALNEFFRKLNINTRDSEFKRIYVNGDNNLENLRTDDEQWKVVLIEEAFHKLMFEANEM